MIFEEALKAVRSKKAIAFEIEIAKELGDCLWYISRIASAIRFELSDIAKLNVDKLSKRKTEGKLHGSGDNR